MLLGTTKLLELVKTINLVENLCERELKTPEGAGFDLRLGNVYQLTGSGFIGITHRKTPERRLVVEYGKDSKIIIDPGQYFIGQTIEKINLPSNITAFFGPRITTYMNGLIVRIGLTAKPGSSSNINFAISNQGPVPVEIELGSRLIHVSFCKVDGLVNQYKGQWKGNRTGTPGMEKQI
ncbi:hypothetical protein HN587_07865 [Candidatus Woesearchaeota archaeon]|nr:hypothetical protein [Candidatus Woesearchaeota archaeon]